MEAVEKGYYILDLRPDNVWVGSTDAPAEDMNSVLKRRGVLPPTTTSTSDLAASESKRQDVKVIFLELENVGVSTEVRRRCYLDRAISDQVLYAMPLVRQFYELPAALDAGHIGWSDVYLWKTRDLGWYTDPDLLKHVIRGRVQSSDDFGDEESPNKRDPIGSTGDIEPFPFSRGTMRAAQSFALGKLFVKLFMGPASRPV